MKTNLSLKSMLLAAAAALVLAGAATTAGLQAAERSRAAAADIAIPEYLSPELRAQVEALKKDVARSPTSQANAAARVKTFYAWMNAYAATGRPIPVNAPQLIGAIAAPGPTSPSLMRNLDAFIAEFALYEERPEALGRVSSDTPGPFPAAGHATLRQTFTVGSEPIRVGGGLVIGRQFMANQGDYQTTNPAGANYVTARASNPRVKLEAATRPLVGMFGGFRGAEPALYFRVAEGELKPGDTVTITIGDRSAGGPGFLIQSYANDALPIPLFLKFDAETPMVSLPISTFVVEGGPVAGVKGFVPSTARVGEAIALSVRGEDRFRNRATGPQPAYELMVNGKKLREIPAGSQAITVLNDIRFDAPGVYRFSMRSKDGKITGVSNPVWVRDGAFENVYWGETHAHSGFAEGQGSIDYFYTFGRDDARLDFLGMSEHDVFMDDFEWNALTDATRRYHDPGRFITYLAYEWTVSVQRGGHHNVFFRTPDGRERIDQQRYPTLPDLYRGLREKHDPKDVLIIPHAHMTADYTKNDPEMETLIEIMSLHGTFEWFGKKYLENGHEVGFIAASDDHLSHPGYAVMLPEGLADRPGLAAVIAPEKTNDSIFDAMKQRSAYATTGERIILDMDLSGGKMGQRIAMRPDRALNVRAIGTSAIGSIAVVKNGVDVHAVDYLTDRTGRSGRYALEFASNTDPKARDVPRGARIWEGVLEVSGATLTSAELTGQLNVLAEYLRPVPGRPNAYEFRLNTRGRADAIYLELDQASPAAKVSLKIAPSQEYNSTPMVGGKLVDFEGLSVDIPLSALRDGAARQTVPGAVEPDSIALRAIRRDAPADQTLRWTDPGPAKPGDYYFVRVTQADGGMAWSSPVWVGGE